MKDLTRFDDFLTEKRNREATEKKWIKYLDHGNDRTARNDPKLFVVDAYNKGFPEVSIVDALQVHGNRSKQDAEDIYFNMVGQYESVNEAFNKKSAIKAMGKSHDAILTTKDGDEYIIYNPDSGNDDNTADWKNDGVMGHIENDGDIDFIKWAAIKSIKESVNEKASKFDPNNIPKPTFVDTNSLSKKEHEHLMKVLKSEGSLPLDKVILKLLDKGGLLSTQIVIKLMPQLKLK